MPNDEQKIRDVIDTWMRATAKGELAEILKLMDEDAVFLVMGQPPMRGRDAFAASFKQALQKFRLEATSEIQEIQVMGDWAYCWNHLSVTMTPIDEGGSPVRCNGNVLTIFRKNSGGDWVLFRDANLLGG
ncbi:MAG: SgcJ/EcaC family oxidoreductase [Pyrinomonadaceae bacterium]